MPNVDFKRPEYEAELHRWVTVDDTDTGEDAVKAKKTEYLPQPNADDNSPENNERYKAYLKRTVYVNFVNRTTTGLTGEVFAKDPVIELPPTIDKYHDDIDGHGVTLEQQSKKAVKRNLKHARGGLFVDYSKVEGEDITQSMIDQGLARPAIVLYDAKQIINWRVEKIGGLNKLVLVVIKETQTVVSEEDEFEDEEKDVWRVLKLEDSIYTQELYEESDDTSNGGSGGFVAIPDSLAMPTDMKGQTFDTIPFQFFGTENNDSEIDKTILYDIATVNLGHYRNSSSYEQSVFDNGVMTIGINIGEMTPDQFKAANGNKIRLGSTIVYGNGGGLDPVQAEANTIANEAMLRKEEQMVALGARIMQGDASNKTATATDIDNKSQTSMLSSIAQNISQSYQQALYWMEMFSNKNYGTIDDITFELSDDYSSLVFDPAKAQAYASLIMSETITQSEARDNLRETGMKLLETDEEYKAEIEANREDPDTFNNSRGGSNEE